MGQAVVQCSTACPAEVERIVASKLVGTSASSKPPRPGKEPAAAQDTFAPDKGSVLRSATESKAVPTELESKSHEPSDRAATMPLHVSAPRAASPGPRAASPGPRAASPGPRATSPGARAASPGPRAASPRPRGASSGARAASPGPRAASPGSRVASPGPRAASFGALAASSESLGKAADQGTHLSGRDASRPAAKAAEESQPPCRSVCAMGTMCKRRDEPEHLAREAHPFDADYAGSCAAAGMAPEEPCLRGLFDWVDLDSSGKVTRKELEKSLPLISSLWGEDVRITRKAWERLDEDGNGLVNFSEFAEWAGPRLGLPLGVVHLFADGKSACGIMGCPCEEFSDTSRSDTHRKRRRPSKRERAGFATTSRGLARLKICRCGHKFSSHVSSLPTGMEVPYPLYWDEQSAPEVNTLIPVDDKTLKLFQCLFDKTHVDICTDERKKYNPSNPDVPKRYQVLRAWRCENSKYWREYGVRRAELCKDRSESGPGDEFVEYSDVKSTLAWISSSGEASHRLQRNCNEWYLFYGSSPKVAKSIASGDFKFCLSDGPRVGDIYGRGVQFAECITKADETSKPNKEGEHCVVLSRVLGGRVRYVDDPEPDPEDLLNSCVEGPYDSILGDQEKLQGKFREFVIYDSENAYADYIIHYRREMRSKRRSSKDHGASEAKSDVASCSPPAAHRHDASAKEAGKVKDVGVFSSPPKMFAPDGSSKAVGKSKSDGARPASSSPAPLRRGLKAAKAILRSASEDIAEMLEAATMSAPPIRPSPKVVGEAAPTRPSRKAGGSRSASPSPAPPGPPIYKHASVCLLGMKCSRRKDKEHLAKEAHPLDKEYADMCNDMGVEPEPLTLKGLFDWVDLDDSGKVSRKELKKAVPLISELCCEELKVSHKAWERLDEDGNGCVNFSEFAEWAGPRLGLPLGVRHLFAEGKQACGIMGCPCQEFRDTSTSGHSPSKPRRRSKELPGSEPAMRISYRLKVCACGHKYSSHQQPMPESAMEVPYPSYWDEKSGTKEVNLLVPVDPMTLVLFQDLFDVTYRNVFTRDRKKHNPTSPQVPKGYKVLRAWRCENSKYWREYGVRRAEIHKDRAAAGLDAGFTEYSMKSTAAWFSKAGSGADRLLADCNEWYLFHGTEPRAARSICSGDFKIKLAGGSTGTLYGRGTYFAESITKADEYAKPGEDGECAVLLCRVLGGRVRYIDKDEPDQEDLVRSCIEGPYDCILGDREKLKGTFREVVIYDSENVYAEYIIYYKRKN